MDGTRLCFLSHYNTLVGCWTCLSVKKSSHRISYQHKRQRLFMMHCLCPYMAQTVLISLAPGTKFEWKLDFLKHAPLTFYERLTSCTSMMLDWCVSTLRTTLSSSSHIPPPCCVCLGCVSQLLSLTLIFVFLYQISSNRHSPSIPSAAVTTPSLPTHSGVPSFLHYNACFVSASCSYLPINVDNTISTNITPFYQAAHVHLVLPSLLPAPLLTISVFQLTRHLAPWLSQGSH